MTVIAYIVREGGESFLCVMDDSNKAFHKFPLDDKGTARLAAEASRAVNLSFGGYDGPLAK